MSVYKLDDEKYAKLARQAVAEGCVLLKNDDQVLPLGKNENVAVFGRIASTYYKSGLGSGGMVNTSYVVGILDALRQEKDITVNEEVRAVYDKWIEEHPFDEGQGWGMVPWSQAEMPVSEELFAAASGSDVAVVVIGRTAGEDQDNHEDAGSYLLTEEEKTLIDEVTKHFAKSIVVLNVGNIIDMNWVKEYNPSAVLYAWQGGQEGGNGVADVLLGRVNPCGKLTDTIAYHISDYPSNNQFGNKEQNYYEEDIYVGYRYFETFAKDKVMYPFGYGMSYTSFLLDGKLINKNDELINVEVKVKNTGNVAGKEVVQVYISAPQGLLGKPAKVLAGFAKTKCLNPNEEQIVAIEIPKSVFASFDDSGVTGHKNAFVLEAGEYIIHVGSDVRNTSEAGRFNQELTVVEQCVEAIAPVESFERFCCKTSDAGELILEKEDVPTRTVPMADRIKAEELTEIPFTGDKGYKLKDVYDNKVSMDDFIAQLDLDDLIAISRGEGMSSPKVTPGTAAAFGGITDKLKSFGIPALCATDGPSGIRMDCGTQAFSLPNGTLLGCTFDLDLVNELYEITGKELRRNKIDTLLGPGINIHRHPLNGRNFEYISEDPLLTGKMAVAQIKGLGVYKSSGTIKHFSTNNQEHYRREVNAVVSARALREIYLKCFEIAVKEGDCKSVMTTYGPLNGLWTAGCYDLNTTVLRNEWGFKGIVMTDWWAVANDEGEPGVATNHAAMLEAQNDLIMVCRDASDNNQDNILESVNSGRLSKAQLQRNCKNILNFALQSVAMEYEMGLISDEEIEERKAVMEAEQFIPDNIIYYDFDVENLEMVVDGTDWETKKGTKIVIGTSLPKIGLYDITFKVESPLEELAQLPVTVHIGNNPLGTMAFRGTVGEVEVHTLDSGMHFPGVTYIRLYFGATGLKINEIKLSLREEVNFEF